MPHTRSGWSRLMTAGPIIVAVAMVAACGTSSNSTSSSTTTTTKAATSTASATAAPGSPAAPRGGKDHIAGTVASESGPIVQVSHDGRASSVNLAAAQIAQLSPAEPTDVTVNSCVRIRPTRDSADSQNPVARMVVIGTPPGGQCASSTPSNTTEPARAGLHGAVTAVGSGTLTVDGTTVSVNQATKYVKRSAATIQAVANGQCMTARGTNDASGTLQAATATVRAPVNGQCSRRG
jgi:Domain of unknown function (DUF5666)